MPGSITIEGLGKRFHRYHEERPRSLKEALLRGLRGRGPAETFWALRHVNLDVKPGRMIAIIGENGAGKSTLLRLMGGIGQPDEGHVSARGRITGLLELGAGFHPDLTGRENVFVNGVIAGLRRRAVAQRFDSIVDFAELATSIDSPLRTYSTGMRMRLGFAVAIHTDPDILLIDEVLAVGDRRFAAKCLDRIGGFKAQGCAIVVVSHDLSAVRQVCDEVVHLRRGEVANHGTAKAVTLAYEWEGQAGVTPAQGTAG